MSPPGYVSLPHTTDAYLQVTAYNFEKALERAGMALFDTMCDVKSISPRRGEDIEVTGADESSLLYNWLESLLLKFELERKVYSKFRVKLNHTTTKEYQVNARIYGETYNRKKHGAKVEVKAVTYHKMEIRREGRKTTLRFILDL